MNDTSSSQTGLIFLKGNHATNVPLRQCVTKTAKQPFKTDRDQQLQFVWGETSGGEGGGGGGGLKRELGKEEREWKTELEKSRNEQKISIFLYN